MTPLSLRTKLTLFYTGILAVLLTGLGFVYYRVLELQLDEDATATLREITDGIHGYLHFKDGVPELVYDRNDPEQVLFIESSTRYYQVFDAETGRLLGQSSALEPLGLRYTPTEVQSFREHPRMLDIETDRGRLRLSNTLMMPSAGESYLLQVGLSLRSTDAALGRLLGLILWSVPLGLVAAGIAGRWMAGRALAPLAALASAARAIRVTNLGQRLPVRGANDELDEVAHAFNDTFARLDQSVGEMKQFSAALAHELRTPLAALRGETELALLHARSPEHTKRALESQLEEFDRLSRLISQLLTLARAEAGEIPLTLGRCDLGILAAAVVDTLEPVAQATDLSLVAERGEDVVVIGDPGWMERLLVNLIDNAIKFTEPGGRIVARVWREHGQACVDVVDTGIGIAPEDVPHVFERFYRADPSRTSLVEGSGLGLTLAKWIADRHGASLSVKSRPGEGATFSFRMPLAPAERVDSHSTARSVES